MKNKFLPSTYLYKRLSVWNLWCSVKLLAYTQCEPFFEITERTRKKVNLC